MRQNPKNDPMVLNSWKEISAYLGRGVRTLQRWESQLQLPVHRVGDGERSPVYAFPGELRLWLRANAANGTRALAVETLADPEVPFKSYAEAVQQARVLSENLAVLMWKHQRQTELLVQTMKKISLQLRSRTRGGALWASPLENVLLRPQSEKRAPSFTPAPARRIA
jgi:hypothetical protein